MESPCPKGSLHPGGGTSVSAGVSGGVVLSPEQHLSCPVFTASACSNLLGGESFQLGGDVFLDQYRDVDVSSEWLSSFVEECLSSAGNYSCLPVPTPTTTTALTTTTTSTNAPADPNHHHHSGPHRKHKPTHRNSGLPGKPRSQRKRRLPPTTTFTSTATTTDDQFPKTHKNPYLIRPWPDHFNTLNDSPPLQLSFSDPPPLLEQAYWLADSELILPLKKTTDTKDTKGSGELVKREVGGEEEEEVTGGKENNEDINGGVIMGGMVEQQQVQQQPARRCSHCQAQKTPQWRAGPLGPKTLCNACGVRYFKSGKLLPEYRPAKSPTFVSYKHSNSHKKVLQMRMAFHSSSSDSNSDTTMLGD